MINKGKLFIVVNVDWFFLSHRKDIALRAQSAGWDVTVVTADTGKLKDIEAIGLKAINLPMSRSGMNIMEELKTLIWLRKLYKREKPDVVHHVGMKTILWGTLAAKFSDVNGVVNAISGLGGFFAEDNKGLMAKLMPMVLKFSHSGFRKGQKGADDYKDQLLCIFQNDDDWGLYVKHGIIKHEQGRFIKGSGVDMSKFNYTPEPENGTVNVILTARMIVEKGIYLLTEAAERLRSKYEGKVEFWLVGMIDDHPGAPTKEELESHCDGKYIQWLGYRTDVKELLKKSHIMAFPSYYMEGLPKSLIEAEAIGRPVITTNSVGCKDTVVDGENGFLILPKDVDALTEKLDLLLGDAALRQKMGMAARAYAEKYFDIEVVIERHLNIYDELIK